MTHSLTAPAARLQIIHGKFTEKYETETASIAIPREQNTSKNASGMLATCEPINTAITPLSPSLIDQETGGKMI